MQNSLKITEALCTHQLDYFNNPRDGYLLLYLFFKEAWEWTYLVQGHTASNLNPDLFASRVEFLSTL